MEEQHLRTITIIYYCDDSLELKHHVGEFPQHQSGRVIISDKFKEEKSIIAVCDGEIDILNKVGDRIRLISDY